MSFLTFGSHPLIECDVIPGSYGPIFEIVQLMGKDYSSVYANFLKCVCVQGKRRGVLESTLE